MKHLSLSYACLLLCIYFGYQAPRAATAGGVVMLYCISAAFLIICLVVSIRYEQLQLFKNKVPRSTKFKPYDPDNAATHPPQDGVYAIQCDDNGRNYTVVSYWTEGAFLKLKRVKVTGWAGPYAHPDEVLNDKNPLH